VRLDAATRRKFERLAAQVGISLNDALNRLLRQAIDDDQPAPICSISRPWVAFGRIIRAMIVGPIESFRP
jgi:hypothetical protein